MKDLATSSGDIAECKLISEREGANSVHEVMSSATASTNNISSDDVTLNSSLSETGFNKTI